MSDELLLTLLWLLPAIGAAAVLLLPKRAETAIKGVSLAFTVATFVLSLVAFATYQSNSNASEPLATRAQRNTLTASGSGDVASVNETGAAVGDLMIRRPWIPYFNIQYYLGVDGISLSLVLLTGLV